MPNRRMGVCLTKDLELPVKKKKKNVVNIP